MILRKKTWPRLLTYIVLLLSLTREVSAVEIVASNVRGVPGEQVLVSVELTEATGTASASFSLGYDATQLTLKQTSLGDLGERFDLASFNPDTLGQFTASFLSATGITAASGSLVTLTFAIAEQALSDSVALTLSAIEFTDREADQLPTSAIHGYIQISMVPAPIADFTASLIQANVRKTIAFTSESTGEITSLEWDFGDGATSTESQTSHAFQDTGIYAVSLTVNGPGGSDTHALDIIILVSAPIADFTASLIQANAPETIAFTSKSTGEITSREWDFGDGTWRRDDQLRIRTELQTIHTFQDTGIYAVSLTVNGPGGFDTHTLDVIIGFPAPIADFTTSLIRADVEQMIAFTSESTGEITGFEWDFGDGATSTESQTSHAFQDTGIYAVSLTVNGPGGSDTHTLDVSIGVANLDDDTLAFSGDFNGDGVVNFSDFFIFGDHFGGTDPGYDLDRNGLVDFGDFFIFADQFGKEAKLP